MYHFDLETTFLKHKRVKKDIEARKARAKLAARNCGGRRPQPALLDLGEHAHQRLTLVAQSHFQAEQASRVSRPKPKAKAKAKAMAAEATGHEEGEAPRVAPYFSFTDPSTSATSFFTVSDPRPFGKQIIAADRSCSGQLVE